jgi:phosphate transport system permease protein
MSQPMVGPAMEYVTAKPTEARGSLVRGSFRFGSDTILFTLTSGSALIVIALLAALVAVVVHASMISIHAEGLHFLTTTEWIPPHQEPARDAKGHIIRDEDGENVMVNRSGPYGALAVVYGTAITSIVSLIFAVPLSLGAALFLVRISPKMLSGPVSFLVEFLAAIPSIAYGMWGALVFSPFLQNHIEAPLGTMYRRLGEPRILHWLFTGPVNHGGQITINDLPLNGRDLLCGGCVLAIMIVPIVTAISRDVLKSVPRAQIEGTVALGATWWQSSWEMVRYSRAGLFGAIMLGLARASGETMAVTMVVGNVTQVRSSLFAPLQTMSSLLANEFPDASEPLYRSALCEVALVLLVMSLLINVAARYFVVGSGSRSAVAV